MLLLKMMIPVISWKPKYLVKFPKLDFAIKVGRFAAGWTVLVQPAQCQMPAVTLLQIERWRQVESKDDKIHSSSQKMADPKILVPTFY